MSVRNNPARVFSAADLFFLRKLGTKRECLRLTDARNASAGMASVPADSIGWDLSEGSGCLEVLYWFPVRRSVRASGLLPTLLDISLMKTHLSRVSSALSCRAAAVNCRQPGGSHWDALLHLLAYCAPGREYLPVIEGKGLTCDYSAESTGCLVFG